MVERNTCVELSFVPTADLIPVVRRFVASFYGGLLDEPELAERMALATHELLENAVKFSNDGRAPVQLEIESSDATGQIAIRTRNRGAAEHLEQVKAIVAGLNAAGDAFDHYQEVMRRSARRQGGSGLGLARICAEADMTLTCDVQGEQIAIVARASLPPRRSRGRGVE